MSWKQIAHPPDWTPLPVSTADAERIELDGLSLTVERLGGRAASLRDDLTGLEWLSHRERGITFRLLDVHGLWIDGPAQAATSVRRMSDTAIEVTYSRPTQCGVTFPVELVLRYELERDPRFGPALVCSYEIEHLGGEGVIERVQFPVLSGVPEFAGAETELLLPFIQGERRPAPLSGGYGDFEYIYPNEAMSFMALCNEARGLYLGSEDPGFRWTVLRGRTVRKAAPPALELLFETCPFLREGERARSQRFVLHPYAGSWHRAADRYRAWLDTWWHPPPMPDRVRELRALVELFFEMPYADGRVVRRNADELYAYMERCWEEMGLDVAHICGYHVGGFDAQYPLYEPLPEIGGAEGIRQFATRCNSHPNWTTDIYINCRITDVDTSWWGDTGRKWACTSKDGSYFAEFYNGRYFTIACPAVEERRDYWLRTVRRITREWGIEGLQVDQPHTTARECWAYEAHDHLTPFDHWGPGFIELFRNIREELTSCEPRVWSWGEAASDVFSQFFDFSCCYVRYPDRKVAFGETDPATRDWEHDWRGYGMPELFRYCCPEVPMLQAPMVCAGNPEDLFARLNILFLYSPMMYWPSLSTEYDLDRVPVGFRRYVRHLWDVRHELRDTMIHGRFRDTVGMSAQGPDVLAKVYVSGPGRRPGLTVVAINRSVDSERDAEVAVEPPALLPQLGAVSWRWRALAIGTPDAPYGSGPVARVRIPANRVAVVHFEPE
jgi:hypothetical protein